MNFDLPKLTWPLACDVQPVSSFQQLALCILDKTKGLSHLKMNTNSCFGAFWWLAHVEGELDFQNLCKLGLGGYPLLFAPHTHGLRWIAPSLSVTLKAVVMSVYDAVRWGGGGGGGGGSAVLQSNVWGGEKIGVNVMKPFHCVARQYINIWSTTVVSTISYIMYIYIHCEYINIEFHLATITMIQYG